MREKTFAHDRQPSSAVVQTNAEAAEQAAGKAGKTPAVPAMTPDSPGT